MQSIYLTLSKFFCAKLSFLSQRVFHPASRLSGIHPEHPEDPNSLSNKFLQRQKFIDSILCIRKPATFPSFFVKQLTESPSQGLTQFPLPALKMMFNSQKPCALRYLTMLHPHSSIPYLLWKIFNIKATCFEIFMCSIPIHKFHIQSKKHFPKGPLISRSTCKA